MTALRYFCLLFFILINAIGYTSFEHFKDNRGLRQRRPLLPQVETDDRVLSLAQSRQKTKIVQGLPPILEKYFLFCIHHRFYCNIDKLVNDLTKLALNPEDHHKFMTAAYKDYSFPKHNLEDLYNHRRDKVTKEQNENERQRALASIPNDKR